MGVLCSKPGATAERGNGTTGVGGAVGGLRAELCRPLPKSLISPPQGNTLEVFAAPNVDGVLFGATQYQRVWCALSCLAHDRVATRALPFGRSESYQSALRALDKTLADIAVGSHAAQRSMSPTQQMNARSPATMDAYTLQHAAVPFSFEELAYKLFSSPTAGDADEDDDDDFGGGGAGAGFDVQVYRDDDPFEYNNANRLARLHSPPGDGGRGGLLHANYNPLLTNSLASHPQHALSTARRRSGSSSCATTFPLDVGTIKHLASVLYPSASSVNSKGDDLRRSVELFTECGTYFASNPSASPPQQQPLVAAGKFLTTGNRRGAPRSNSQSSEGAAASFDYFVSFDTRCAMLNGASSSFKKNPSREDFYETLQVTSRAISIALYPVSLTISVALGRFVKRKRGHHAGTSRGSPSGPSLRRRTSNMSNDQAEPETLEECVRFTLRNYWRSSEPDLRLVVDAALTSLDPTTAMSSFIVPHLVDRALKLQFLMGGGWGSIAADDRRLQSNEDLLLADALQVDAVNIIFGALTRAAGFDGFRGMHVLEEAEQWALCLREISFGLGLLPRRPELFEAHRVDEWWPRFIDQFPLFLLADDAKQTVLYLHAILLGQQKLSLQPVMRADALRSVAKTVGQSENIILNCEEAASGGLSSDDISLLLRHATMQGGGGQSSFRLFPVLATEGMGLESGEGHGPRKELLDLCAGDVTAPRSLPMDITSAATFQLVSSAREVQAQRIATGVTIGPQYFGKPVLMVAWKQRKLVGTFQHGDVITMSLERRGGGGSVNANTDSELSSGTNSSAAIEGFSPGHQSECWTVEGSLEASNAHESLIVLSSTQARIPLGFRVVSCKVELKRNPPFRHDSGNTYAWLNPVFLRTAAAARKRSAGLSGSSSGLHQSYASAVSSSSIALDGVSPHAIMYAVGWLLANGVPNGLVLPCALPPFLFRYMRCRLQAARKEQNHHAASYVPHPSDACLVNSSLVTAMDETLRMTDADFHNLMLAEGFDPAATTREEFVQSTLLLDTLWNSGDPEESRLAVDHLVLGFASSPLASCPVFLSASCSKQMRSVLCGAIDQGTSAFSFQEHFRIVEDSTELSQFDHSVVFREVLWDVLENGFPTADGKRQLLKFITGRTLLPPRKKAEHIKVEFPLTPMNAREFGKALSRLPSSHSCDNVLEVVNVLECLLFRAESPFYGRTGRRPGGVVLDDQKESAWSVFSLEEQNDLRVEARRLLRDKLRQAVTLSGTYELDDAAVPRAAREAFEAANAGSTPIVHTQHHHTTTGGGIHDVLGGFQSASFEHNSSQSIGSGVGTPAAKRFSTSGGGGVVGFQSASSPQHMLQHTPSSFTAPAKRASSSAALNMRATTQVEEFDYDEEDLEVLDPPRDGTKTGTVLSPPPPPLFGNATGLSADSTGVLLGRSGRGASVLPVVGSMGAMAGSGLRSSHSLHSTPHHPASTTASSHHHLSMFDQHNAQQQQPPYGRPSAAVALADGFDDDVDVVELEDDFALQRLAPSRAVHPTTTPAAPPQPQKRTGADIDDLMTELFPARK